jgi:ATP-binding cassette, subfamily B (MDR/TAP), member 1
MISDWKVSIVIMVVIPLIGLQGYAQVKFLKGFSQDAKINHKIASWACFLSYMMVPQKFE